MSKPELAICIKNTGYEASLIFRKIYNLLEDEEALGSGLLRVVDESGEDYLFPKEYFIPVELPSPFTTRDIPSA